MNFHFGFYDELNNLQKDETEADFGFLENVDVTSENDAYDYLHGCCEEFAAILSDIYGYEIECVRNANNRLIHAYCIGYIGDEKAYIDIRGITTDKTLFFEEFDNEMYYYAEQDVYLVEDDEGYELEAPVESWPSKNELFDGDYEDWDDGDIRKFISDNASYYDTNQFKGVFTCKECSEEFVAEDEDHDWFYAYGEEDLWGHLQLEHPEIFEEFQTLETPDMLEMFYEHSIRPRGAVTRSLDDIISSINKDNSGPIATGYEHNIKTIEKRDER